jgi:hypothetical protein
MSRRDVDHALVWQLMRFTDEDETIAPTRTRSWQRA